VQELIEVVRPRAAQWQAFLERREELGDSHRRVLLPAPGRLGHCQHLDEQRFQRFCCWLVPPPAVIGAVPFVSH
jgi:hypothetical protein